MNESYDGPHIDKFITMQPGRPLPEEAYDTPQDTLANLRDGEWTGVRAGSVMRDFRSGLIFVDTFDSGSSSVTAEYMAKMPFIAASCSVGGLRRYILDMRRLRNLRFQIMNFDIDPDFSTNPFDRELMKIRKARLGTELVSSFILPHNGEVKAYVEKDLEIPASIFAQEVDEFEAANREEFDAGKSVKLPTAKLMRSDIGFHRDVDSEFAELINSTDSNSQD